jgi:hypothetical protein
MAAGDKLPQAVRLMIKRRGAGAEERDVYPTVYLANTPQKLAAAADAAGFKRVAIEYVGTLHRYAARVPPVKWVLIGAERGLPAARRSTMVASYR